MPRAWKFKQKDIVISRLHTMQGSDTIVSMCRGEGDEEISVLRGLENCDWRILRDRLSRYTSSATFQYSIRDVDIASHLVQPMFDVCGAAVRGRFEYAHTYYIHMHEGTQ